MKIYFAGSIRGGRDDAELYSQVIALLQQYGQVLTEHIGDMQLSIAGEAKDAEYIFARDVAWIREADVIVAEVSTPSLGVGYEIGLAESVGKKILCLYRPQEDKKLSVMVSGNKAVSVSEYSTLEDIQAHLAAFFG